MKRRVVASTLLLLASIAIKLPLAATNFGLTNPSLELEVATALACVASAGSTPKAFFIAAYAFSASELLYSLPSELPTS